MRYLFFVPILAFFLAMIQAEAGSNYVVNEPIHALEVPQVELFATLPPAVIVDDNSACDGVSEAHDAQAGVAVQLSAQVPARRWYHHTRGCVAY